MIGFSFLFSYLALHVRQMAQRQIVCIGADSREGKDHGRNAVFKSPLGEFAANQMSDVCEAMWFAEEIELLRSDMSNMMHTSRRVQPSTWARNFV